MTILTILFSVMIDRINTEKLEECCICLEEYTEFIKMQQCIHFLCARCFTKVYIGDPEEVEEERGEGKDPQNKCPLCRRDAIQHWNK